MLRRIREPFGKAGLIVAVVALIAALAGGAYAASGGLTGKQKKEVKKIAKEFAGKDGAQGPAGQAGSQGPKGDTGAAGTNGTNGENGEKGDTGETGKAGKDGKSVEIFPLAPSNGEGFCEETGGAKFTNGTETQAACNGKDGKEGSGGSPETMAGYWEVIGESGWNIGPEEWSVTTISFPFSLATAPTETILIKFSSTEEEKTKCPGEVEKPEAATTGVLCLYPLFQTVTLKAGIPSTFGAVLAFAKTDETYGTWAVKAP